MELEKYITLDNNYLTVISNNLKVDRQTRTKNNYKKIAKNYDSQNIIGVALLAFLIGSIPFALLCNTIFYYGVIKDVFILEFIFFSFPFFASLIVNGYNYGLYKQFNWAKNIYKKLGNFLFKINYKKSLKILKRNDKLAYKQLMKNQNIYSIFSDIQYEDDDILVRIYEAKGNKETYYLENIHSFVLDNFDSELQAIDLVSELNNSLKQYQEVNSQKYFNNLEEASSLNKRELAKLLNR